MRVLIVKLSAFGDIIHSLSVIDCFREFSGKAGGDIELHWLVEKRWAPILKGCPEISNIITTNTKGWRRSPLSRATRQEVSDLWSSLRRYRYDLVVDINGLIRSAVLARIARADLRAGFSGDSQFLREKHSALLLDRTYSVSGGHVVDQTVALLEKILGIEIPGPVIPGLPKDEKTAAEAERVLNAKGLIPEEFAVIAAGGGWETKLLDESLIADMCDRVSMFGIKPVLAWAGQEEKRMKGISRAVKYDTEELGNLPVDIFIEVLRMSRMVIGPRYRSCPCRKRRGNAYGLILRTFIRGLFRPETPDGYGRSNLTALRAMLQAQVRQRVVQQPGRPEGA